MFPLTGDEGRCAYLFFRGWISTFATACAQIDAILGSDKRAFHWTRLREKSGAPSFAYRMEEQARFAVNVHRPDEVHRVVCEPREGFDPIAVEIQELVLETETRLRSQCIICSAPSTITNAQGPWASLCAYHCSADLPEDSHALVGPVWKAAQLPG